MLELNAAQIRMGRAAPDKLAALALLAEGLVDDGLVEPGYLTGMQAREAQGSTYLGQGIAIPHGTPETRDQVKRTGVRLIQFPDGVDWGDGQQVYLAIAVAARSDEHLHLLQLLTRALGEGDLSQALREAGEPEQLVALLQGAPRELALDSQLIGLGVAAEDFDELVWHGARLLKRAGCVASGFAGSLLQSQPLPLGEGLWWLNSEQAVEQPGLAFVTPARPLVLHGQPLTGLFCLASLGEAHRQLLERLCDLLIEGRGATFSQATCSRAVLEALGAELPEDWPSLRVTLANAHGLHARPAKALVEVAQSFDGEIRIRLAGESGRGVSAKSLSKLLALGARRGQALEFSAEPAIAADALPAIEAAVLAGLGESIEPLALPGETPPSEEPGTSTFVRPRAPAAGTRLQAVAAAPGIAIGPALVRTPLELDYPQRGQGMLVELQRLDSALAQVTADIQRLIDDSEEANVREIFITHQAMLRDPTLREDVNARLADGFSAEAAWSVETEAVAQQQEALHDALLAERAADLRDIGRRVLAHLCGVEAPREPDEPYILVMDEVAPSDVASLNRLRVAGILTARGGATAHSAIIARALGIPAIVGAGEAVLALAQGTPLLLDGDHGVLRVAPDAQTLEQARREREANRLRRERAHAERMLPAVTRDGHAVEVAANIGASGESAEAVELGAEGVGLLRTELVFMDHAQAPDRHAQEAEYRRVLDGLGGRPLVVRTLDVGGDKPLPYWPMPAEENPFLGVRGIRLSLQRPDILETQLRALLASADGRPLRIMFPMVGGVEEWRIARDLALRLREEIPVDDLQLGIMVEVPSAALLAPVLAREVDFFSIGTNDLTQYALAIDRGHPTLSAQADGLHPAVLRLIGMTVEAAHAEGKWVGVCGELAGDMLAVPLLVGLGVDELSVSARSIALVKARVRELDLAHSRALAQRALALESAGAVRDLVGETH
ncbi:fructose-specific multiphosphoryl transfer protein [Azotobacter vinelandii CA]|uniref:phosphoenolpyruvate--protein phosphotransferase n=2 Tax=Azotobacter vinelandii TaxID=354 RepID=C1DPZ4_AZOVD|nr:phosphoenolpyruvate--protein phosphotransferase [Azotobacter vinelandii]ACO77446.1 fructose-specific multiphosphoryl transfer protein [Azotobacter vinelandii DJ]AGK13522.1 fructose-specific multiphosphoryl transfer protein [Azotobacter vinelandii CA]AGK17941.1 fructose-specific multiphosphoryl transfer protein [Azotobacter vinelandii CA6]WKN23236.1 phosphoenolpyruvate--protein phosphotransferase [Azotobacter vinelandii]SFY07448.1 Phosphocarrier protein HPr /phosphoenolpyruvate--protein phos